MQSRIITVSLIVLFAGFSSLAGQTTVANSICPSYAAGSDSLLQPGESFWLEVQVDSVDKLFGTSFELYYDTTYLDLVSGDSITAGPFWAAMWFSPST